MIRNVENKGPGGNTPGEPEPDLRQQVADLQAQVERLENALQAAGQNPAVSASNAMLARESQRVQRHRAVAREVKDSPMVKVRTRGFIEKIVNKKVQRIPTNGRPIAFSSRWRSSGIWPDAPSVLQPEDENGDPITHVIPRRVYDGLKEHLELVPD